MAFAHGRAAKKAARVAMPAELCIVDLRLSEAFGKSRRRRDQMGLWEDDGRRQLIQGIVKLPIRCGVVAERGYLA